MKTIACINAITISPYATLGLSDGVSAYDRVRAYTGAIPGLQRVVVFAGAGARGAAPASQPHGQAPDWPPKWEIVSRAEWSVDELLGELQRVGRELADADTVLVYYFFDAPFLDIEITGRMLASHRQYFAEYTFADGFPDAVAPTVLNADMPERLRALTKPEDDPRRWDELFTILRRDINAFEVETELAEQDYRQLRLHLRCDCRRNYLLCRALYAAGARDESSLLRLVTERPELLRTVPAYSSVQIVRSTVQAVVYDPFRLVPEEPVGPVPHRACSVAPSTGPLGTEGARSATVHELAPERFGALLDMLAELCGDAVVEISHWGDAGLHSRLDALVAAAAERASVELIVRSGGVGWPAGMIERVAEAADSRTRMVVELDADDEQIYRQIRGEGFREAQQFSERALELFGERCHLQAVRMDLNEEQLEVFYRRWKERTPNVIIQKYDDCAGRLPSRRVVDLSPLHRLPCWHIKRDLVVLIDGSVPMCKQDFDLSYRLGNVFEDGIEAVWQAGEAYYRRHVGGDLPPLCWSCDEYYTFNF